MRRRVFSWGIPIGARMPNQRAGLADAVSTGAVIGIAPSGGPPVWDEQHSGIVLYRQALVKGALFYCTALARVLYLPMGVASRGNGRDRLLSVPTSLVYGSSLFVSLQRGERTTSERSSGIRGLGAELPTSANLHFVSNSPCLLL